MFDNIKDLIVTSNRDGLLIFLDAPGGAGKTFTLNVLVTCMITTDLNVANSTTSGIAASLLSLGQLPTTDSSFLSPLTSTQFATKKESDTGKFLSDIKQGMS